MTSPAGQQIKKKKSRNPSTRRCKIVVIFHQKEEKTGGTHNVLTVSHRRERGRGGSRRRPTGPARSNSARQERKSFSEGFDTAGRMSKPATSFSANRLLSFFLSFFSITLVAGQSRKRLEGQPSVEGSIWNFDPRADGHGVE